MRFGRRRVIAADDYSNTSTWTFLSISGGDFDFWPVVSCWFLFTEEPVERGEHCV